MTLAKGTFGRALLLGLAGAALTVSTDGMAQTAAPITVVPPSIAPAPSGTAAPAEFTTAGALAAPAGSEKLQVAPSTFVVEGGFAEFAAQTAAIVLDAAPRLTAWRDQT